MFRRVCKPSRLAVAWIYFVCLETAMADDWEQFVGSEELHEFVAGARAAITVRPGVAVIGTYNADGTASLEAWGETFARTWSVLGEDQVCYSSVVDSNCYRFERNQSDPDRFRAIHVETREVINFRTLDKKTEKFVRKEPVDDDGGLGSPSAAEIAAALSDPNTNLGSMNFQFDHIEFEGDIPGSGGAQATRLLFQPSLPYALSDTSNLFLRPAIPVIFDQDVPDPQGGFESKGVDLGDISFDAAYAKTLPSGLVVIGGVIGTFPTATDDALGLDQWLLGPEAALAVVRPWGVLGALVTHQWDVAGEDDYDTSITGGQYFYALNLGDGWQINSSPTFSYNHEADNNDEWAFPLGIGVAKTTLIRGRPWKFGLQYWHYIEQPDTFGPDYQLRLSISPVVSLPW